jgi:hypothetical protein
MHAASRGAAPKDVIYLIREIPASQVEQSELPQGRARGLIPRGSAFRDKTQYPEQAMAVTGNQPGFAPAIASISLSLQATCFQEKGVANPPVHLPVKDRVMRFQISGRTATQVVVAISAALAAINTSAQEASLAASPSASPASLDGPRGIHWKNDPESIAAHPNSIAGRRAAAEASLAADNAKPQASSKTLTYYGGPLVKNIKVIQVLYGSGTYQSFVQGTGSSTMAAFYGGVVGSPYFTWLNGDYGSGSGKTTKTIGYGTFAGQVSIAPSSSRNGSTITDAQVQAELAAQISAGHLAAPNANTYYAVFFPKGKKISQGGSSSCVSGGFCAYHGTVVGSSATWTYGVHPDNSAGSGCDSGCGSSTAYHNMSSVASHEMIETVTDPDVGIATTYASPLAWYNKTYGEIGDICNAKQGTVVGTDGVTYTVQTEWSNSQVACRAQ